MIHRSLLNYIVIFPISFTLIWLMTAKYATVKHMLHLALPMYIFLTKLDDLAVDYAAFLCQRQGFKNTVFTCDY